MFASLSSSTPPKGLTGLGGGGTGFAFLCTLFFLLTFNERETFTTGFAGAGAAVALCCCFRRRQASNRFRLRSSADSTILSLKSVDKSTPILYYNRYTRRKHCTPHSIEVNDWDFYWLYFPCSIFSLTAGACFEKGVCRECRHHKTDEGRTERIS